jgi:hypothetical protein
MTYFTPEFLALGLTNDDDQLNEQEQLWDEAGERYVAYLDSVRPHMPPGLRHLDQSYYLHDALIQGMGQEGRLFVIVATLDTPPRSLLLFRYDLVEEPVILPDALPAGLRTTGPIVDWQYDEIEMVPGNTPTWNQSILFNNGWEVRLHFRDVQVQEVQALIPAPHPAAVAASTLLENPSLWRHP